MTINEQIKDLFGRLGDAEKELLLQELSQPLVSETVLVEDAPIISCPHCGSKLFVKNGKRGVIQNYKCKSCCKIFTFKTGTPFHKIQKMDKFEAYRALMMEGYYPLQKLATKVGISIQTAFDWRHKILTGVTDKEKKFEGITEIDDIWFLYSQKGRKGLDYSRKRGGRKGAGDNDFQAKLLVASDRKSTTDLSVAKIGRLSKSDIQRKISGRFAQDCILVSDKHRSIASFAQAEGIKHISFKADQHTAGGEYHIQNVNNLAARLKGTINHSLKGVSTKYLQSYANWVYLISAKLTKAEVDILIIRNKKAWDVHKNREAIYKWFIENLSKRTFRCQVKRSFTTKLAPDMISSVCNI
jgi:transposase-like protein